MQTRKSDVGERMGYFRDLQDSIRYVADQGGFEHIHSDIIGYMDSMTPVGLGDRNQIVLPSDYDPRNGPAVLPIGEDEPEKIILMPNQNVLEAAHSLVEASKAEADLSLKGLVRWTRLEKAIPGSPPAMTLFSKIDAHASAEDTNTHPLYLPRVIAIGGSKHEMYQDSWGVSFAHELDHWRFGLQSMGNLQSQTHKFATQEIIAIMEKQAYGETQYTIERDLGRYSLLGLSPEETATVTRRIRPQSVQREIYERLAHPYRVLRHDERCLVPFTVRVIGHMYGEQDEPITSDEILAMQSIKAVAS